MPFLAPLVTAIGSFFGGIASWLGGSTILAGLARFGLGLAAKYALGAILGPKRQAQSSQLDTSYGEDIARTVAMGKVGTAGQHVYRNAYSKGNRRVQDVYVLSHFRITRITRVRFEGKWYLLGGAEDPVRGFRVQGIDAQIWVKLYKGTMDQAADAGLIANANPAGRWTVDHRGAGVAYAVVTNYLDREKLPQPWQAFFEIEAAPLYDWRKDSSIGGSGAHRWNDQSTWEFSENTVVQAYNLERGFWNGTELMVGKGVSASRLPLAEWTLAANICDEAVGTGRRYSSGLIAAAGSGITHDQNLQPLLEACAATWVEDATGEYPIVGAAQSVAFTVTDDDIMVDEPFRFSAKRTKSELINTLAGTFQNPENFYEPSPITVRIDTAALAEDRERLASSVPFDAVNRLEVADRLADIAFKASRYQANGEICIHPKFLADAKPGRWFRWNSAKYGDRKFQIVEKRLGPFGEKAARNVYLTCQEVGEGIFDPTEYQTVPPVVVAPGEPDYDQEVSGLTALGVQIQVDDSSERKPALRFQWSAFEDVTVVAVEIEYRPVGQTDSIVKRTELPTQVLVTSDSVLANTLYEYRARIVTDPPRTTFFGAWQQVRSPKMALPDVSVELGNVAADLHGRLLALQEQFDDLAERLEFVAAGAADIGSGIPVQDVKRVEFERATARVFEGVDASIDDINGTLTAQAGRIDGVETEINGIETTQSAHSTAISALETASTQHGDDIAANAAAITSAQSDIDGLETAVSGHTSAISSLQTSVASQGDDIEANSTAITQVQSDLGGLSSTVSGHTSAISGLTTSVTTLDGEVDALSASLTDVEASVGELSADGLFQMTAQAGGGDVVARLVAQVRATIDEDWVSAGYVIEAGFVGGDPGQPFSRFIINASQFVVTDGADTSMPFVFEGGELKALIARFGTIIAALLQAPDGTFKLDVANGKIEWFDP